MSVWQSRFAVAVLSSAAVAGGFFGGAALLDRTEFARAETQVETARQQLANVEDLSSVFRDVAKVVEPSVVRIDVTRVVHVSATDNPRRFFQSAPNAPATPSPFGNDQPQDYDEAGTGSGVIMEAKDGYGYILTNNHVAGEGDITISLEDGRRIRHGRLMAADAKADLAVVRIKADNLITAHWGNSDDIQKGDWVLAFGCPLGYAGTMTHGIVSALDRDGVFMDEPGSSNNAASAFHYENFIQVDAPINPGNSGGPLVNLHGDVIGVNTAIASHTGEFNGIGFAIPSSLAHKIFDTLKNGTHVVRGYLGIRMSDASTTPALTHSYGYDGNTGVIVVEVEPNVPASGKLKEDDIITEMNGKAIRNSEQFRDLVALIPPNSKVTFKVFRDGHFINIDVVLGTQPESLAVAQTPADAAPAVAADQPADDIATKLGLSLRTLTPGLARQIHLDGGTSGVVVAEVKPGSAGAQAGMDPGVIITRIGNTIVRDTGSANNALTAADLKKGVRLTVLVPDAGRYVRDVLFLQEDDGSSANN